MPRKKKQVEYEDGEQMDLIEVDAENAKVLKRWAKAYKKAQAARMEAGREEQDKKRKLLAAVKEADVQMIDEQWKLRVDGMIITVKPRDELVRVKEDNEDE